MLKQLCPLRCWALYWRRRCSPCILRASSNRNIPFLPLKNSISSKTKTVFLPRNSCLRYFPISYRAVNGVLHRRRVIGNTPLDIWQILAIKFLFSSRTKPIDVILISDFFLGAGNGSQKITSLKDGQNLCDKVILLGHLLLRFLS